MRIKKLLALASLLSFTSACGDSVDASSGALEGTISIDGSSTVFPITEAVAEEFRKVEPKVRVTVGVSGTGGGFKKFTVGETDVSDASRYIKDKEISACDSNGTEFIELPVAYDGIAVIVNKGNDFARSMTIAELNAMWKSGSKAKTWKDIRPDWPDRPFRLYAPGQDSGTFDYFTDEVNGKSGNCRADATFSEDDNVLVRGVAGDPEGIGYFGFAYYTENKDQLNIVAIDGGSGPIVPSLETIGSGTYSPLSRPLFIYASTKAVQKVEVDAFLKFYLDEMGRLAQEVGYVPLPEHLTKAIVARYASQKTGTTRDMDVSFEARYL